MKTEVIMIIDNLCKGGGKGGAMGLKPHLNWIRWGLAPPQLYTSFRVAEPPDLDAVLVYAPIAQGVITKRSQTIILYTDNRPTSTNHVQVCIALIRKMAQP